MKKLTQLISDDLLTKVKKELGDSVDVDGLEVFEGAEVVELQGLLGDPVDGKFDVTTYKTNQEAKQQAVKEKDIKRCICDLAKEQGVTNEAIFERLAREVIEYSDEEGVTNPQAIVDHVKSLLPEIFKEVVKDDTPPKDDEGVDDKDEDGEGVGSSNEPPKPGSVNPPQDNKPQYTTIEDELMARVLGAR